MNPGMPPYPGTNFEKHKEQALIAEEFKADFFFVADTLWADDVSPPHRLDRFEATTLLAAIAAVTTNIGLVGTMSTTFCEPFNIARQILSLDHISNGRAGWNLVTTDPKGSSDNYGRFHGISHGERYEIGEEAYDVVTGLWDSFEDDALPQDKERASLPDPGKAPCAEAQGKVFRVEGPAQPPSVAAGTADRVHGDGVRRRPGVRGSLYRLRLHSGLPTASASIRSSIPQAEGQGGRVRPGPRTRSALLPSMYPSHCARRGRLPRRVQAGAPAARSGLQGAHQLPQRFVPWLRSPGSMAWTTPFPLSAIESLAEGFKGNMTQMLRVARDECSYGQAVRDAFLDFPRTTLWVPPGTLLTKCKSGIDQEACDGFMLVESQPGQLRLFADRRRPDPQGPRPVEDRKYAGTTLRGKSRAAQTRKPVRRRRAAPPRSRRGRSNDVLRRHDRAVPGSGR